jgi:hypothetical protein
VKRIFAYLKGPTDYGITFSGGKFLNQLTAYSDSDYAADVVPRRSTTGYVLMINGGPVAWCIQRQKCVSLSTTEAEYVSMSEAVKEVTWIRRLLQDIGHPQDEPTKLSCDNQGAVKLVKNPEFYKRSRHIDVRNHYTREKSLDVTVAVEHVSIKDQVANVFTKALCGPKE